MGSRGRLRVYLGAAPGVGKTYAMLGEGHRRAERGTDVVVGFVETHGRQHTAEHARGPGGRAAPRARLPRHHLHRDGRRRGARPPARRWRWSTSSPTPTCPGSRNEKRWQDIEELLAAGIDVITTVNIQHLESVNDVVEKITGVPQRETRAGRRGPRRRPGRAGGHGRRGAAAADGARQRLRRREGRRRPVATTSGSATSPRCASWPCSGPPTGSTRRCRSYRAAARHHRHLGGPRAGRRRAHRRPRGRDPDPPGRADRRPVQPAATCSPCTSPAPTG